MVVWEKMLMELQDFSVPEKNALFQLLGHIGNILKIYQIHGLKLVLSTINSLLWPIEHSILIFEIKLKKILSDGRQHPIQRFTFWNHQIDFSSFSTCSCCHFHNSEQWKYISRRYRWKEILAKKIQWVVNFDLIKIYFLYLITIYILFTPWKHFFFSFTCSKPIKIGELSVFDSKTSNF